MIILICVLSESTFSIPDVCLLPSCRLHLEHMERVGSMFQNLRRRQQDPYQNPERTTLRGRRMLRIGNVLHNMQQQQLFRCRLMILHMKLHPDTLKNTESTFLCQDPSLPSHNGDCLPCFHPVQSCRLQDSYIRAKMQLYK